MKSLLHSEGCACLVSQGAACPLLCLLTSLWTTSSERCAWQAELSQIRHPQGSGDEEVRVVTVP